MTAASRILRERGRPILERAVCRVPTREEYVARTFRLEDDVLAAVRASIAGRGMPAISVAPELGRLLTLLVRIAGAKKVLEIGALGGYSGVCLARGLAPGGTLTSLELSAEYAELAGSNLKRAGFGDVAVHRVGPAAESLRALAEEGERFDFFFIDADKGNYPLYLDFALRLAVSGAVVCADNTLLGDAVIDAGKTGETVAAVRAFNERMASDPRLESLLLPLRDGFSVARVR